MDAVYFVYREKRVLVLGGCDGSYYPFLPSLPIDILILCNNPRINIPLVCGRFNISMVVVDGSNYPSYTRRMEAACREAGVLFHSTRQSGSLIY